MNKSLFLNFGFLFLFSLFGTDLPVLGQQFNAGVFGGLAFSQVDGDFYGGYKKLGLNGGINVSREISNNFNWQMEIKYVSRGAYDQPSLNRTVYRYIELPLSIHYLYKEKYQPELGLSPETLISYASFDAYGKIENDPAEIRRFGLSGFAGFTYWFLNNTGINLRFTYSIVRVRKPEEWNNYLYPGYFHNVISLSLYQRILPR